MWKFKSCGYVCNDVHADRRIVPLSLGIIIHLDGVDYCIIMQHRPFHSLRIDNDYNRSRSFIV